MAGPKSTQMRFVGIAPGAMGCHQQMYNNREKQVLECIVVIFQFHCFFLVTN